MSTALRAWVEKTKGGRSVLARRAGVRWQTVDDILDGKHTPRASTAKALSAATGGEVSAAAILGLDEGHTSNVAPATSVGE